MAELMLDEDDRKENKIKGKQWKKVLVDGVTNLVYHYKPR